MPPRLPPGGPATPEDRRVFISYKRNVEPDASVAALIREALARQGHAVFIDVEMVPGTDWQASISAQICEAEFFVVLISDASLDRRCYVGAETIIAAENCEQTGYPRIVPIRLRQTTDLPLKLERTIGHIHDIEWLDAADNDSALQKLLEAIGPAATRSSALKRGDHFIVTPALWSAPGWREDVHGTTIVPVTPGDETRLAVTRSKRHGIFVARVAADGGLEVAIWEGSDYRAVQSCPGSFVKMLERDSHTWSFTRYAPDGCVLLERSGGRRDPIVITFDRDQVHSAWQITHQRGTQHERFLIVSRHPEAG